MVNITISIPDELRNKMKRHSEIKWSEVVRKSLASYVDQLEIAESGVVSAETLSKNLKDTNFVRQVINPLTSLKGLVIESLRSEDFKKAANLMDEFKLDYEDSLHLAVAIRTGAQEIISNDKDFDHTQIKRSM